MIAEINLRLVQYWLTLDRLPADTGHPLPRKASVVPSGLTEILPHIGLIEYLGPSEYRFRLAGTWICARMGRELRGHRVTEKMSDAEATAMIAHFDTIRCGNLGGLYTRRVSELAPRRTGDPSAAGQMVSLPVADHTGRAVFLLIAVADLPAPAFRVHWPTLALDQPPAWDMRMFNPADVGA